MNQALNSLRQEMQQKGIDAYLIFNTDDHNSEYIAEDYMFVKFLSGFSGDNAVVVVTENFAGLWTDSRYFISAEKELKNSEIKLMKSSIDISYWQYIKENIKQSGKVSCNGKVITAQNFLKLKKLLSEQNISFDNSTDLSTEIWQNRPKKKLSKIFYLDEKFSGENILIKLSKIREKIKRHNADYFLTSGLDDIAWTLNLRASDISFCPVFFSFLIIEKENNAFLFADQNRFDETIKNYLEKANVKILPYNEVYNFHSQIPESKVIMLDTKTVNSRLYTSFSQKIIDTASPIQLMKAVKNATELKNFETAMIEDGVAMEKFFYKFEKNLEKNVPMTELSAAKMLLDERKKSKNFLFESFECISAFNLHAAMPHYAPNEKDDCAIEKDGVYLVDSGGQYLLGTTDITRTIPTGKFSLDFARDYTLVLIGNLNLAMQKFPSGTTGSRLDVLARQALWQHGLDFGHGTGHGVGYCLNCHEGPHGFSSSASKNNSIALEEGMIITDEPGFYKEGFYGIRHENMLEVKKSKLKDFMEFSVMTLCHIDTRPIVKSLLTLPQIEFLNAYNKNVYDTLEKYLNKEEKEYLKNKTLPI